MKSSYIASYLYCERNCLAYQYESSSKFCDTVKHYYVCTVYVPRCNFYSYNSIILFQYHWK